MSSRKESSLLRAPEEPVKVSAGNLRNVRWSEMALRFAFGAATSTFAGILTLLFGARTGGVMLAFPAILAATLTLIAKEEHKRDAREDARGATAGAFALALFAATVALLVRRIAPGFALGLAALVWVLFALGFYRAAWVRKRSSSRPR